MKVAIVTDSYHPTRDGVVVSIDSVSAILRNSGHDVSIIAPDPGKSDRMDGVTYFPSVKFKSYAGYFVPIFPSNKKLVLEKLEPDVIHVQGIALMTLKGVIAAHNLGLPVVLTFHTMVGDTMKYYSPIKLPQDLAEKLVWKYLGYLMRWVDAIVAPTESVAKELKDRGMPIKDMRVIPTPIDTSRFSPDVDGSRIKEKYGLKGKRVVICVGRVSFEKEIDKLIRALAQLDQDIVLLVVGKGPAMESLKDLAKELGLQDRVIFTGFVSDEELVEHYTAADIAATASRFETQCFTALEAMACGLPVACANARAFVDYIEDGKNGFLFGNTTEECADAMKKAFAADDVIKQNAMKTVSEFSADNFYSKIMSLYEDVIERKRSAKEEK